MTAIHDDVGGYGGLAQGGLGGGDGTGVVVGAAASAAHYQMAVGVAAGFHDGRLAVVVNAEESLGGTGGDQGIYGGLGVAVGAVLEADGH